MMTRTPPGILPRGPACNTENSDQASRCIACGHVLPAAGAARASGVNYAFPQQVRPQDMRMVGKREFSLESGLPPPLAGLRAGPPPAPAPAATVANSKHAADSGTGASPAPYFNPTAFGAGAAPPSWYQAAPRAVNRYARALWLAAILALVAGGGAVALWRSQPPAPRMPASQQGEPPIAAAVRAATPKTSAGELPYDGAAEPETPPPAAPPTSPPVAASEAPTTALQLIEPAQVPQQTTSQDEAPPRGAASVVDTGPSSRQIPRKANSAERSLTPRMLAQCASMTDDALRAECTREVCNGKWGQNGCPPADTPAR